MPNLKADENGCVCASGDYSAVLSKQIFNIMRTPFFNEKLLENKESEFDRNNIFLILQGLNISFYILKLTDDNLSKTF